MSLRPGEVVLVLVPTLAGPQKWRPGLVLCSLPGIFQNVLICGFSSQLDALEADWDELIDENDVDYKSSDLRSPSAIRLSYLIAVDAGEVGGVIGDISAERLSRLQKRLADRLLHPS